MYFAGQAGFLGRAVLIGWETPFKLSRVSLR